MQNVAPIGTNGQSRFAMDFVIDQLAAPERRAPGNRFKSGFANLLTLSENLE